MAGATSPPVAADAAAAVDVDAAAASIAMVCNILAADWEVADQAAADQIALVTVSYLGTVHRCVHRVFISLKLKSVCARVCVRMQGPCQLIAAQFAIKTLRPAALHLYIDF